MQALQLKLNYVRLYAGSVLQTGSMSGGCSRWHLLPASTCANACYSLPCLLNDGHTQAPPRSPLRPGETYSYPPHTARICPSLASTVPPHPPPAAEGRDSGTVQKAELQSLARAKALCQAPLNKFNAHLSHTGALHVKEDSMLERVSTHAGLPLCMLRRSFMPCRDQEAQQLSRPASYANVHSKIPPIPCRRALPHALCARQCMQDATSDLR